MQHWLKKSLIGQKRNTVSEMLKSEMIDYIMTAIRNEFDNSFDFWQDITGAVEAMGISDIDVVRMTLEGLNDRQLLVPLLLKAYEEGLYDWQFIDSIAGNYGVVLLPKILNKLNKQKLQKLLDFYGEKQ